MNFTIIGKALAFITVALSLLFLGFAVAIYSNHVDWPGGYKTLSGRLSEGEVPRLQAEAANWQAAANLARDRWLRNSQLLAKLEAQRPMDQKWYADQLKLLEEGSPADGVKQVVTRVDKDGKIETDSEGHPLLELSASARYSRRGYRDQFNQQKEDAQAVLAATTDLVNQQKELTQTINGEEGKQRGLRALIHEEEVTQANSADELEHLKPLRINRQVEGALLQQRNRALAARLEELKQGHAATARR